MRTLIAAIGVASALAASIALAQSGPEVLKTKGCSTCHEADKKKVGPSYKDIAARGGDAKAIVAKLKDGKGHPKAAATEAELNAAVTHILSLK